MEFLHSTALVFFQATIEDTEKVEKPRKCWFSSVDEGILLDIFSFLQMTDLLRVARVCRQWNRVAKDAELWQNVDLSTLGVYFKRKDDLENFLKTIPMSRLRELNLSGMTVRGNVFSFLASNCPRLKKLVLKSTTLRQGNLNQGCQGNGMILFPRELEHLDLRYSNGDPEMYLAMSGCLRGVRWLGISDALIYAHFSNGTLESTFQNLPHLKSLDTSHCLLAKDHLLSIIASCRGLEVLSMRKCLSVKGYALDALLSNCKNLKVVILDGTCIEDNTMTSLPWERASDLACLELGCCPLVSSKGLQNLLPKIARNPSLEYLGFQNIGNGNSINDKILDKLSKLYFQGYFKNLKTLNAGSRKCFSKTCLTGFTGRHPEIDLQLEGHRVYKNNSGLMAKGNNYNQVKSDRKSGRDRTLWSQHYLETPV